MIHGALVRIRMADRRSTDPVVPGQAQVGLLQVGLEQDGPAQVGLEQVGPAQVGTVQVGPAQVGIAQVGPAQVGLVQAGPAKVDTLQVSTHALSAALDDLYHFFTREISHSPTIHPLSAGHQARAVVRSAFVVDLSALS